MNEEFPGTGKGEDLLVLTDTLLVLPLSQNTLVLDYG
jgi:hypothetical protein